MFLRSSAEKRLRTRLLSSTKLGEHAAAGPRVAGVLAAGEAALGEVERDPLGAGGEALADVPLALVADVLEELRARIALHLPVKRVQERQHGGRDHRLLERLLGDPHRLLDVARGVGVVAEAAVGQLRKLPVVPVGEEREILPARHQFLVHARAGERVGERIGREAGLMLLAVRDDRGARGLHPDDRVAAGLVLFPHQLVLGDPSGVVGLDGRLQLGRAGQGSDILGGHAHGSTQLLVCRDLGHLTH